MPLENRILLTLTLTGPERDRVIQALERPERPHVYRFPISVRTESGEKFNCKELTMYDLKVTRKVHVVFGTPVDEAGNKAKVDGMPTIEALNPDIAVFEQATGGDGFAGHVKPIRARLVDADPAKNVASFKLSVDADLGPEVRTIEEVFSVNVVAGEAVDILGVQFGQESPNPAEEVPPPPPPVEPPPPPPPVEPPPVEPPPVEPPPPEEPPVPPAA
jgi:hypothetical protein